MTSHSSWYCLIIAWVVAKTGWKGRVFGWVESSVIITLHCVLSVSNDDDDDDVKISSSSNELSSYRSFAFSSLFSSFRPTDSSLRLSFDSRRRTTTAATYLLQVICPELLLMQMQCCNRRRRPEALVRQKRKTKGSRSQQQSRRHCIELWWRCEYDARCTWIIRKKSITMIRFKITRLFHLRLHLLSPPVYRNTQTRL